MIEASATYDKYSLAICCFLVIGDANGKYLASLSSDELSIKQRHQLSENTQLPRKGYCVQVDA